MGSNLGEDEEVMAPRQRVLGKKKVSEDEVVKTSNLILALPSQVEDQSVALPSQQDGKRKGIQQVEGTFVDTSKDHETHVALGNAMMLF